MRRLNRELGGWFGLVIVTATVFEVACSSKSSRDADWEEVQKAAIRVESGLRHETLIALRSKVADLDAAVANYTRQHPEDQKEQRVRAINQAVDALECGIDHEKTALIWDGTDGFAFYSARPYLNVEPKCAESEGKLYINGHDLSSACLAYAQNALLDPDKPTAMREHDFNALRTKCSSDYANYQKQRVQEAEARHVEHLRLWPLQVDLTATGDSGDAFIFRLKIDDEDQGEGVLLAGQRKHIDAKREVRILTPNDDNHHHHQNLSIIVNGRTWTGEWTETHNWGELPIASGGLETAIVLEQ